MNKDKYYIVKSNSEGIFKDKGSKFISFCIPVKNEEEVKSYLLTIKKKYHSARHHCYAYMLGENKDRYRSFDDGEPTNSAGKPILGQIESFNLTNILIVIVRYFGGTLLGVGGLINAYKKSAADAITNNIIIEQIKNQTIALTSNYGDVNYIMRVINETNANIIIQDFGIECKFQIAVPKSKFENFKSKINKNHNIKIL